MDLFQSHVQKMSGKWQFQPCTALESETEKTEQYRTRCFPHWSQCFWPSWHLLKWWFLTFTMAVESATFYEAIRFTYLETSVFQEVLGSQRPGKIYLLPSKKKRDTSELFSMLIWCWKVAVISLTVAAVPWVYSLLFPCAIPYWSRWKLCHWEVSKIKDKECIQIDSLLSLYEPILFKSCLFICFFTSFILAF